MEESGIKSGLPDRQSPMLLLFQMLLRQSAASFKRRPMPLGSSMLRAAHKGLAFGELKVNITD